MLGTATNTLHLLTLVHCTNKIFQSREGPHTKIEEHSRAYSLTDMRNALICTITHTSAQTCTYAHTHRLAFPHPE